MPPQAPAKDAAKWTETADLWLDHVTLVEDDLAWMARAKTLTMWSVKLPEGFLPQLPVLVGLDVRGGSGTNVDFVQGCESLLYLTINQVRGTNDLSAIEHASGLEYLSLYGLPQVTRLPSLARLGRLDRVEVGSMKGLEDISGILEAPALTELVFVNRVSVRESDAAAIAQHPSLEKFSWFGEGVPNRIWVPFVETVNKPDAQWDWHERHPAA